MIQDNKMNYNKDTYWKYFDEAWKKIIERFFPHLLRFFIPHLYQDVDLSNGFIFLDKEMEQLSKKSKKGAKYVDKLVKVRLKDGRDQWILVHIEVQGYADKEFPERMFRYFYRIFDKYNEKIVSLALITGAEKGESEGKFEFKAYGSGVEFQYLSPRLMEYDKEELEKSDNPIALIILACQGKEEAKVKGEAFNIKLRLIRSMYEKGRSQDYIRDIFEFTDWVITLSDEEENLIWEEIEKLEEVNKMPYVTSIERIGIKRGMKRGSKEAILEVLDERFGGVPSDILDHINNIEDDGELKKILRLAVKCASLDELMQMLNNKN
jgi:hypothetical protein